MWTIGTNKPCMINNTCSKRFPRQFEANTLLNNNGYPEYRRRSPENGGFEAKLKSGTVINNKWIVPYNPYLILKYNCHLQC